MLPQGPAGPPSPQMSMMQASMQAQQAAYQRGYMQGGYPQTQSPYPGYPQQMMPSQGSTAGGGAYNSAYAGAAQGGGGFGGFGEGRGKGDGKGKGDFKGKGKGKGKGKSKGKGFGFKGKEAGGFGGGGYSEPWNLGGADAGPTDPRKAVEMAQRKAKGRDRSAISQAQRSAAQRFEKDLLERVQGHWVDASNETTYYSVEGPLCSVTAGDSTRVFRNKLCVVGSDLCWDARRFWHNLNLNSLPPVGEEVTRVEWTPGEGSPMKQSIVWLRSATGPPERPSKEEDATEELQKLNEEDENEGGDEKAVEAVEAENGAPAAA